MIKNIAVLGGGSWATALVKIFSEQDVHIRWQMRDEEQAAHIRTFRHNPKYLSGVQIDTAKVTPYTSVQEALTGAHCAVLAVPSAFLPGLLQNTPPHLLSDIPVVSAVKGMIPETNLLVTDYIISAFGAHPSRVSAIVGPCHSEEVALERQSYLTVACTDLNNAETIAELLRCRFVNCTCINDISGAEYAAVMKNVVALATGMARGLNFGDNFISVLIANAMQEMARFLDAMWPANRDLNASAYLGDVLVTAYSQFSRNRTLGNMLGRGYSAKAAMMEMNMVAEGYYGAKCIYELNKKLQVDMPVCTAVYNVLYEKIAPGVEFEILKSALK